MIASAGVLLTSFFKFSCQGSLFIIGFNIEQIELLNSYDVRDFAVLREQVILLRNLLRHLLCSKLTNVDFEHNRLT